MKVQAVVLGVAAFGAMLLAGMLCSYDATGWGWFLFVSFMLFMNMKWSEEWRE